MADQERRIIEGGGTVCILKGCMTRAEKDEAFESIQLSRVKFILTNPETLRTPNILGLLSKVNIIHVVKGNPDRTNNNYSVVPAINKVETLLHILKDAKKPVIIFSLQPNKLRND